MRKMILLALASFLWKQFQKRTASSAASRGMRRR